MNITALNTVIPNDCTELETIAEELATREEFLCKGYVCGADLTII